MKRELVVRLVHRNRARPARLFRIHPDPSRRFVVEVRLSPDIRRMREERRRLGFSDLGPGYAGSVISPGKGRHRPQRLYAGGRIAFMFLNARDLRRRPGEIIAHECTHAGMAWARFCRANLRVMDGEEVLCYAVGEMVRQVNRIGYAAGVFR